MKHQKTVTGWLLLAVILLLGGCAEESAYTLEDARALLDAGAFDSELAPLQLPNSVIAAIYGIDEDTLTEFASYHAANSAVSADEATVFILTGEDAAQAAEAACRTYLGSQIDTCRSYCPAAVPSLEADVVRRAGSTVLLAVGNPDRLAAAVDRLHP